jgi:ABC-type transport system involved in multi-copper enzyme maturation permease subunit
MPVQSGGMHRYPVPWRPMTRATWLQHRGSLITAGLLFAAFALVIVESRLGLHGTNSIAVETTRLSLITITLLLIPVLAGMFIGAPLIARELEAGSFRFAWTQGIGRTRWVVTKMVLLCGAGAAATGALGFLADWYASPFEAAALVSRWQGGQFNVTVLTLPAWTLFSLAAGTFAGALIGRVVAAMAATAAFVGGLIVLDFMRLHDWFLGIAPDVTRGSPSGTGLGALNTFAVPGGIPGPRGSWLVNGWYTGPDGQRLSSAAVNSLVNKLDASRWALTNPAGWLGRHHDAYWLSYQPVSRFWGFQGAEVGILLAITMMLVAATIGLVNRRI